MSEDFSIRERVQAVYSVAEYRPVYTAGLLILSVLAAVFQGIGLSFILPIIELARGAGTSDPSGVMQVFVQLYALTGVPLTLETTVIGVSIVITLRYSLTFIAEWVRVWLHVDYGRNIRAEAFQSALNAQIEYFDQRGSDEALNAIITQSDYASRAVNNLVNLVKVGFTSVVYLAIAIYLSPLLTLFAVLILGGSTVLTRVVFGRGTDIGAKMAETNKQVQTTVQAGMQGIRDAKLFRMKTELFRDFTQTMEEWTTAKIKKSRNRAGINNSHQLVSALSVFLLIYLGIEYASLSLGSLGVFLFAMFRLAPQVSRLNDLVYSLESNLPHVVRSQRFLNEMRGAAEPVGDEPAPECVRTIEFDEVSFAYEESEQVLQNVSFSATSDEFVAFVGQSGAGKSTIISLLARMYEPTEGQILANGTPISEFNLDDWRERIAVVRQQPFIFNDTLRYNLTIGNRNATQEEVERVAEIAHVDEFIDDMPDRYETILGDDGVRLSGGKNSASPSPEHCSRTQISSFWTRQQAI